MNKKMMEKFRGQLLEEKDKIIKAISQDSSVDLDGDEIDEIQGGLIASIQNQLSSRDKEKLSRIDMALAKISNKTFGLCEDCGEEILEKRLSFNPSSITCVSCAEEREINERKR